MKLLFVLPNDHLGGAEQYLKLVAEYFREDEVHVLILKPRKTGNWDDFSPLFTVHYNPFESVLGQMFYMAKFLIRHRNLIFKYIFTSHVYYTALIGFCLHLGILRKSYFVARESTSIFNRYNGFKLYSYKLAYKLGYRKLDLLICQTSVMKEQLVNALPWISQRTVVEVIPNPINLEKCKQLADKPLQIEIPPNFIISAGRLIPEKGFDLLIKAFNDADISEEIKLVILGEGPERSKLTTLIKNLNLESKVLLIGQVKNVYPYFSSALACIVSSRIEGFPNVLLQMMSQNERVGSTLCAGGIEAIPKVVTCLPNDILALKNLIETVLKSDHNNRIEFDIYLESRNINAFIRQVNTLINTRN